MTEVDGVIVVVHAIATLAMVGLIWFVQIVHYPMFANVGPAAFPAYAKQHVRRTSWVVGPLMSAECGAACWLAWYPPPGAGVWTAVGFVLLLAVWVSTATLQVPCHRALEAGHDLEVIRRLTHTNWIRTIAWSARGAIAVALLTVAST